MVPFRVSRLKRIRSPENSSPPSAKMGYPTFFPVESFAPSAFTIDSLKLISIDSACNFCFLIEISASPLRSLFFFLRKKSCCREKHMSLWNQVLIFLFESRTYLDCFAQKQCNARCSTWLQSRIG